MPVPDVSAILGMLNNNNLKQQQLQSGHTVLDGQSQTELERIFASFSANNQGQLPQQTSFTQSNLSQAPLISQALLQQQQQQQQQATSATNPNLQAILAALAAPNQAQGQQPSQQPTIAALQQPNYAGMGMAAGAAGAAGLSGQTPNLGALLASLGHNTGASSSSAAFLDQDQQAVYEDPERKRARESGDLDERDGDFNKRRKWSGKPKQQVSLSHSGLDL